MRFKFDFTHNFGNNLYIDDINITSAVGLDELNAQLSNVFVFPNPANDHVDISFNTLNESDVKIELFDVSGRMINTLEKKVATGEHKFEINQMPEPGLYLVKMSFGQVAVTKKLIVQ